MKNLGLFTVSTFDLIPMVSRISRYLCDHGSFSSAVMVQCQVGDNSDYHAQIEKVSIGNYSDRREIKHQSIFFKIVKYLKLLSQILKFYLFKDSAVIYLMDLATLNLVLLLETIFPFKRHYIIYHQYEILEIELMTPYDRFNFWLFKRLKNKLHLFVSPEQNRTDYFVKTSGLDRTRTFLFPNTTFADNHESAMTVKPNRGLTMGHIGITGHGHYVHEFIDALGELEKELKLNLKVVFIGFIHEKVLSLLKSSELSKIELVGDIPHGKLKDYYRQMDFGIILYKDLGLNFKYCAPNKLYEYWSHGVPVIAHQLQGLAPLFGNDILGMLTDMSNKDKFKNDLLKLFSNNAPDRKNEIKQVFEKELSIGKYLDKLGSIIFQNTST